MTLDDCKGMPHVVIFRGENDLRVVEFTGPDSLDQAHGLVMQSMRENYPGVISVCVRVRQTASMEASHLMR